MTGSRECRASLPACLVVCDNADGCFISVWASNGAATNHSRHRFGCRNLGAREGLAGMAFCILRPTPSFLNHHILGFSTLFFFSHVHKPPPTSSLNCFCLYIITTILSCHHEWGHHEHHLFTQYENVCHVCLRLLACRNKPNSKTVDAL